MPAPRSSLRSVAAAAAMTLALACGDRSEPAPAAPPATSEVPAARAPNAVTTEDAAPPAAPEPTQLVVDLAPTASGGVTISLGGRVLAGDDELEREARRALAASPDLAAVIRPTRETPHGEVVRVMDVLKAVGIRRLAIATGEAEPGAATPASGAR